MNRILISAVCGVACFAMSSVADAQIVRVGPYGGVSIRAPFVSIDAIPYGGGARVRAPFTSVNTGAFAYGYGGAYRPYGYGYYRPYGVYRGPVYPVYPAPIATPPVYPEVVYPEVVYPRTGSVYPQTGQYQVARPATAAATSGTLSQQLRASAQQLKQSLSMRRDDADVWINYLGPDRIVEAIDTAAAPGSLGELLRNYEGVVGNGTLGSIRGARGFSETYRLLRDFVQTTPAAPATPSVLAESVNDADSDPVPVRQAEPAADEPDADQPDADQPDADQPDADQPDAGATEPTPATPVKPAESKEKPAEGLKSEELPLPTPSPL